MKNVLIVTAEKGFLLMAIKTNLESVSYRVIMIPPDIDAINGINDPISCILLYCDDDLGENLQPLYFLKDKAITDNIPIVAIGEAGMISKLTNTIPSTLIRFEFARPINVRSMVDIIDRFLQQNKMKDKKKILVVDDSGTMLRNVKGWLEGQYEVFLANSGAMAIKYISLHRPDLILLDYDMPICDGKQVMEMIRAENDFVDIPIIFLTGKGDKESIMQVMALKPEGYLLKSLEPAQIVEAVDVFFSKQKALMT